MKDSNIKITIDSKENRFHDHRDSLKLQGIIEETTETTSQF